ncbi:MAG: bifunctional DNA-formamidopyrimidine glycosylase/DNA-(apurinic or apyrimidinic site) lyase [FCB group bacterium]|nr:bifunctional DNA-formamidopyrimidine glycosylase/DNA-(apurinic or apyrimidinic site) lyase [FCB group bacterium]
MPELPEVETVVRGLRKTIRNKTIKSISLNAPPSSIALSDSFKNKDFKHLLKGKKILAVNRRGKNILITLTDHLTLWVHLKMTGHFFYDHHPQPINKHDLVIFHLSDSSGEKIDSHLHFNDYRRFGRLRLFPQEELWEQPGLKELGPEPLEISVDDFIAKCQSSRRMIKPALLDQSFLAGLGNIYADESLYFAHIHPQKLSSSISKKKLTNLHYHIQRLLKLAIKNMGTSVDSFSGVNGKPGRFQKYLKAYHHEGNPCYFCGHKIIRIKIGSRSAHFCPRCQRL